MTEPRRCSQCDGVIPPPLAGEPAPQRCPHCHELLDAIDFEALPQLGADGRLVNPARFSTPLPPKPAANAPLELVEREKPNQTMVDELPARPLPPTRRRGLMIFGVAAVLALGLLVGSLVFLRGRLGSFFEQVLNTQAHYTVVVTSEPAGATVSIAGAVVGTTPWAGDNLWGVTGADVVVKLKGYQPWSAKLAPGQNNTLAAKLHR